MSMMNAEFGDFAISGSCVTHDGTTPVPIYELTPGRDGYYTLQVLLMAWQPNGACHQRWVAASWHAAAGVLTAEGVTGAVGLAGSLTPAAVTVDVSGGKGRLLVTGVSGAVVLWRMKGDRFDLTA